MFASSDSSRLSTPERLALAHRAEALPTDLENLAADENLQVRRAAAANPTTPSRIIELLMAAGATRDLTGVRGTCESLSAERLRELVSLGEWGRYLAAAHPDLGMAEFEKLADDPVASVRQRVAENPQCSRELLTHLCGDTDRGVRIAAAKHPATPGETIERFAAAGSEPDLSGFTPISKDSPGSREPVPDLSAIVEMGPWGRQLAARHPAVAPGLLQTLADDPEWAVRAAVAENPNAGPELLSALVDLDVFEVKLRVAAHPRTAPAALARLVDEPDTRQRVAVASNPHASPELLRRLACDGAAVVREPVAQHPGFAEQDRRTMTAAGSTPDLLGFAAPDPSLGGEAINQLAQRGHWGRRLATRHPNTPAETLEQLLTSGDPTLREAALRHPASPAPLIALLATLGSRDDLQGFAPPTQSLTPEASNRLMGLGPWARRLLSRHPEADTDSLSQLAHETDPQTRREVARHGHASPKTLGQLASDISHEVRWTLVNRPTLPSAVLETLLRDPLATIRLAAVDHAHTPAESLNALRFDLDEDVRAAVKARLLALAE